MQARLDLKARCWLLLYFKKNKSKNHLIESEKLLMEKIFSSFCEFFICKIKSSQKKKRFFWFAKIENFFLSFVKLNPLEKILFSLMIC